VRYVLFLDVAIDCVAVVEILKTCEARRQCLIEKPWMIAHAKEY